MLCSLLISAESTVTRSLSHSAFLHHFTVSEVIKCSLFSSCFQAIITFLLSKDVTSKRNKLYFSSIQLLAISINIYFFHRIKESQTSSFIFFIWKELYIPISFQLLWSEIMSSKHFDKKLISIVCCTSGLGAVVGSLFVKKLQIFSLPFHSIIVSPLVTIIFLCLPENNLFKDKKEHVLEKNAKWSKLIKSKNIIKIMLMTAFIQASSCIYCCMFDYYVKTGFPLLSSKNMIFATLKGFIAFFSVITPMCWYLRNIEFIANKALPIFMLLISVYVTKDSSVHIIGLLIVLLKSVSMGFLNIVKFKEYKKYDNDERSKVQPFIDIFFHNISYNLTAFLLMIVSSHHNDIFSWPIIKIVPSIMFALWFLY